MKEILGLAKREREFARRTAPQAIRAQLSGDDTCGALGITVPATLLALTDEVIE